MNERGLAIGYKFKSLNTCTLQNGLNILDFLAETTGILESRSEAKRAIQANTISVNKQKIADLGVVITPADLLHGKFLMVENGKKNKYLVVVE